MPPLSTPPLSMLPLLVIGLRHGVKWGLGGGLIYAGLQMIQGFWPPPDADVSAIAAIARYFAVVMLDYVVAFSVLGFSGLLRKRGRAMLLAAPICLFLRFLCHFASGIMIWGVYAPEGQPVWLYSLLYNGTYMGIELAATTVVMSILFYTAPIIFKQP